MSIKLVFYFIKLLWFIVLPAAASQEAGGSDCNEKCDNVTIPFPFGIKEDCYPNPNFKVTCKEIYGGKKPFINGIDWEIVDSSSTSYVLVKSPVTRINCCDQQGRNGSSAVASGYLSDSPFFLSESSSVIGAIGCGNLVTIVNNKSKVIGGCLQPRCGHMTSNDCYADIRKSENLLSVSATISKFYSDEDGSKRCTSIFILPYYRYLDLEKAIFPDINNSTQLTTFLEWRTPVECKSEAARCQQVGLGEAKKSYCLEKCGDVDIQYPFVIRDGCYKDEWYQVICKDTDNGRTPFIRKLDLQILDVSFPLGRVRVNHSVSYLSCPIKDSNIVSVNLKGSPFFYSDVGNSFTSVGCGNLVKIFLNRTDLITSCMQPSCGDDVTSNNLTCVMPIPPGMNMTSDYPGNDGIGRNNSSCGSTFVVSNDDYFLQNSNATIPFNFLVELEWAKPIKGQCEFKKDSKISCTSDEKYCWTNLSHMYLCVCTKPENSVSYSSNICAGDCVDMKLSLDNRLLPLSSLHRAISNLSLVDLEFLLAITLFKPCPLGFTID